MDFTTGGRFEVRITSADVGKRVSVRRLTEAGAPGEKFTDTVGVLTSWDSGVLCITRRDGATVRIVESSLVAGKVIPAAPVRRRGPAASWDELDRVAARAWPPVESERLGDWELRWAGGFTRRANSVLPIGDPGLPLDEALERVTAWYGERGRPAYMQVSTGAEGSQERLAAELGERGWTREVSALIRVAALAPIADAGAGAGAGSGAGADAAADASRVVLSRGIDEAWLARYQRSVEPAPEVLKVLGGGPSVWFATVPGDAEGTPPDAIGRCVVDGRWAGFTAIEVVPERRRQGLATAVMAALARRALDEGASAAYLQVESDNGGAGALYDGMGFTTHHLYHHFRAPKGEGR
ncbi:GNAT family N-acetyltransferase [Streptomyces sp. 8N616]|uniref:GNAT family N-acetyltransferase n=1 Tax=Streptomyces sp. 8N616 TaxID=3457414 RepID=UPI003FD33184